MNYSSYNVRVSSLEEVFVKIGQEEQAIEAKEQLDVSQEFK